MVFLAGFMTASLPARAEGEGTSVVRVEDGGDHLRLVGLAPGQTRCGFWSNPQSPAPSRVYEVVVTRAPPPKR